MRCLPNGRAPVRDTGRVASGATGILTAGTLTWRPPRWPGGRGRSGSRSASAMIAVAVTAVLWDAAGARLLLGALGSFLVVRGALLLRGARSGA